MRRMLVTLIALTLSLGSLFLLPAGSCSTAAIGRAFSAPECRAEAFSAPVLPDIHTDLALPSVFVAVLAVAAVAIVAQKARPDADLPVAIQSWFRLVHPTLAQLGPIPIETFQPTLFATRDH